MPRKPREEVAGGVYHVYARGNRREPIFLDDADRREYLSIFGEVAVDLGWRPLAYCLMTNHVHHLVELTERNLAVGVGRAHGLYARLFNRRHATGGGHLFEKRFGSTAAANRGVVMYFACYVFLNPVRAGLVSRPEDFEWSSHAATVGLADRPAWAALDRLLEHFGTADCLRRVLEGVRIMGAAGFDPPVSSARRRRPDARGGQAGVPPTVEAAPAQPLGRAISGDARTT